MLSARTKHYIYMVHSRAWSTCHTTQYGPYISVSQNGCIVHSRKAAPRKGLPCIRRYTRQCLRLLMILCKFFTWPETTCHVDLPTKAATAYIDAATGIAWANAEREYSLTHKP